jgi:hypothetical protein
MRRVPADFLPLAADLGAARSQMAFTLGFHIVLACIGVACPAIILVANYRGLKRGDEDALRLAERWSKVAAVTFVVGAITGTVLSFEMGLLWPEFMRRFGDVFGLPFALEGLFFFVEAIFIAIYIFGWRHLSGWVHFWSGVPVVLAALGGAWSVVAANSWMNQPDGFTLASDGSVTDVDALDAFVNGAVAYAAPHMILAAYIVTGFLVASVYAVGMLRGRRDRHYRLGLLIPFTVAAIATPVQFAVGDTAARSIAKDQPIKFAAMECVQTTHTHVTEYIGGRCTSDGGQGGNRDSGSGLVACRVQHRHRGDRARHGAAGRPAACEHAAPLGLRRHGRDLLCADRPGALVRDRVVAQTRHSQDAVVPPGHGRLGRGGGRGARVWLDRDRRGAPAVDRLRRDAHGGCGHAGRRRVGQPGRRPGRLHRAGHCDDRGAACNGAAPAHRPRR